MEDTIRTPANFKMFRASQTSDQSVRRTCTLQQTFIWCGTERETHGFPLDQPKSRLREPKNLSVQEKNSAIFHSASLLPKVNTDGFGNNIGEVEERTVESRKMSPERIFSPTFLSWRKSLESTNVPWMHLLHTEPVVRRRCYMSGCTTCSVPSF